jgi:hypothetical protein
VRKEGRKEETTEERYPVTLPTPEEAHLFMLRVITVQLGYKIFGWSRFLLQGFSCSLG